MAEQGPRLRPPGKPSPGCAVVTLVVFGAPAGWMLWSAALDSGRSAGGRIWLAVGAALLLMITTLTFGAALDIGESRRRIDLGCLFTPLVLLAAPGGLLLWASGRTAGQGTLALWLWIIGWFLLALGGIGLLLAAFRTRPVSEETESVAHPDEESAGDSQPAVSKAELKREAAGFRIGCGLAILAMCVVPAGLMLERAVFDSSRSDAGRSWLVAGGVLLLALGAVLFGGAANSGLSQRRLDLGCLFVIALLLATPGGLLLLAVEGAPGGLVTALRIGGWTLLGLTVAAAVITAFRRRRQAGIDRLLAERPQPGLDQYSRDLYRDGESE